jgi:hypothetical protein
MDKGSKPGLLRLSGGPGGLDQQIPPDQMGCYYLLLVQRLKSRWSRQ